MPLPRKKHPFRNTICHFLISLASFVPLIARMGTDSVFHDPRLSVKSAVYIHLRLCRARFSVVLKKFVFIRSIRGLIFSVLG
jgi:hypothetical protein